MYIYGWACSLVCVCVCVCVNGGRVCNHSWVQEVVVCSTVWGSRNVHMLGRTKRVHARVKLHDQHLVAPSYPTASEFQRPTPLQFTTLQTDNSTASSAKLLLGALIQSAVQLLITT